MPRAARITMSLHAVRMTARPLRFAVLALLSAALLAACSRSEPPPEPVRAVRTMTVAPDAAGGRQAYAAEVRARVESRLGFRVGGKIVARPAQLGDRVQAGQLLARLDPQDLKLGQDSARAALASAEANFVQTEADLRRFRELLAQGFISTAELERHETAAKAARATLDQARAQAAVQGNQAGYASLVADAAGVVTAVEAEPGQVVAAGAPVLRLAYEGPRDAVFTVPEDRLAALRALQGVPGALRVQLWGADTALPATLRELAAAADPTTRTVLAKADLGAAPATLGQTATVLIEPPPREGVFKLPLTALFESGGQSAVWLLDGATMTVRPQPVQLVGAEGNAALITAGLAAGQEVVTAGVHLLTAGQTVKRYVERSAADAGAR